MIYKEGMEVRNKYNLGDIVYLKTDTEQIPHIITEIVIQPAVTAPYTLVYGLSCGHGSGEHYELELSKEEDKVMKYRNG